MLWFVILKLFHLYLQTHINSLKIYPSSHATRHKNTLYQTLFTVCAQINTLF